MSNFGFISKRKVAREIAKMVHEHDRNDYFDSGACSALNGLCRRLGIVPMHLSKKLGAGTGEMLMTESRED